MSDAPAPGDAAAAEAGERPLLQVVSPNATPEEVAALVAVLSALGTGEPQRPPRRTPEWQSHHRKIRPALAHGPGAWRASGLPR